MIDLLVNLPKSNGGSSSPHNLSQPGSDRPVCSICADTMIAAEASVLGEKIISHLWTCDTCGYGMVTRHLVDPIARD